MYNRGLNSYPNETSFRDGDDVTFLDIILYGSLAVLTAFAMFVVLKQIKNGKPSKRQSTPPANKRLLSQSTVADEKTTKKPTTATTSQKKTSVSTNVSPITSASSSLLQYTAISTLTPGTGESLKVKAKAAKQTHPGQRSKTKAVRQSILERQEKKQSQQQKKNAEREKRKALALTKTATLAPEPVTPKKKKTKKTFTYTPRKTQATSSHTLYQDDTSHNTRIALKNLRSEAQALLAGSPVDKTFSPLIQFISNLDFLYHFHRYNLLRRFLYQGGDDKELAVNLRTLIVHTTGQVAFDDNVFHKTQKQMKTFIPTEVAQLQQEHTDYWVKSDEHQAALVKLAGHSIGEVNFESMKTTALCSSFNYYNEDFQEHINARDLLPDQEFYAWMYADMIPFINLLYTLANSTDKNDPLRCKYMNAIKMAVIILGDYCTPERKERFYNYGDLATHSFMLNCREIRNFYSHNVFNVPNNDLRYLIEQANAINNQLPEEMISADILTPCPLPLPNEACEKPEAESPKEGQGLQFRFFRPPTAKLDPTSPIFIPKKMGVIKSSDMG